VGKERKFDEARLTDPERIDPCDRYGIILQSASGHIYNNYSVRKHEDFLR
jgi:hypothetical protein